MKRVELLAPAGNYEAMIAAVESGADAIYMGGSRFNARAFADNFDDAMLKNAVTYAHIRGVRIYITVNILISDNELEEVLDYIKYLYSIDVDAVIIQDMALLKLIRELYPDFEIHCSTQMTVHNSAHAKFLAEMGANRIVVSRELSLDEIRKIIEDTDVEVEAFIHGALCVCYSGQCYMSSMIGGRSGNRGRCAQPCRRKYSFFDYKSSKKIDKFSGKHLLSTRDLNTYERLGELVTSGIASFKIEGRMKKPEYVAAVVKNYRDAIDKLENGERNYYEISAADELAGAFNREFTEGYLFNKRNKDIVSIDRPDNRGVFLGKVTEVKGRIVSIKIAQGSLSDGDGIEILCRDGSSTGSIISGIKVRGAVVETAGTDETAEVFIKDGAEAGAQVNKTFDSKLYNKINEEYYYKNRKKIVITGELTVKKGDKPRIRLWDMDGNCIEYSGDIEVSEAMKAPLSKDKVLEQFQKTGDTPYRFEELEIKLDPDCFLPVKELNAVRRGAIERLDAVRSILNKDRDIEVSVKTDVRAFLNRFMKQENRASVQSLELVAGIRDMDSAKAAVGAGADTVYYLDGLSVEEAEIVRYMELCGKAGVNFYLVLPIISKDRENCDIKGLLGKLQTQFPDIGVVISNYGQLLAVKGLGIRRIRSNYNLNVFNSVAAEFLKTSGAESIAVSPELNLKQIRSIWERTGAGLEGFVYGHMPLMTMEYCPESLLEDCGSCKSGRTAIMDEKGKAFPIIKLGNCRTQILNSDAFLMAGEVDRLQKSGISKLRADFYLEKPEEIHEIIALFKNIDKEGNESLVERLRQKGHTKGHYLRGVD